MADSVEKNTVSIGFQIVAIRVHSFSIREEAVHPADEITFNIQLQHAYDGEQQQQLVRLQLEIGQGMGAPPLAELRIDCQYLLTGYQNWIEAQAGKHPQPGILPAGLAATLNSISISTARGILFERLRGTTLQSVVLPIIDPGTLQTIQS
jgi:hypothetical protein